MGQVGILRGIKSSLSKNSELTGFNHCCLPKQIDGKCTYYNPLFEYYIIHTDALNVAHLNVVIDISAKHTLFSQYIKLVYTVIHCPSPQQTHKIYK